MRVAYHQVRGVFEQAGELQFCCEKMKREWGFLIGFGIKGHPRSSSREVNILWLHEYSPGKTIPAITDIRYCPWCAEEIEVIREPLAVANQTG